MTLRAFNYRGPAGLLAAILLCAGAGAEAARTQAPRPGMGSSVTPAQAAATARQAWLPVFSFHSGFWMNLHQFLYVQARSERGSVPETQPTSGSKPVDLSGLSAGEREAWQKAVEYYAANFAANDLPYDSFFTRISERLSEMESCPDLSGRTSSFCAAGLAPALTAILESAAPVYRAHWWPRHNRDNLAWIALASAQILRYGGRPAEALAHAYEVPWPADPIPVDVTMYAGEAGSYATFDPFHLVFSSEDAGNQEARAMGEVLYQSSYSLATEAQQAIIDACRNQTKPIPRDLWHALVFYTAAEVMGRNLAAPAAGVAAAPGDLAPTAPGVREYFRLRGWSSYLPLLERYWQPFLDNQGDMSKAVERLVGVL